MANFQLSVAVTVNGLARPVEQSEHDTLWDAQVWFMETIWGYLGNNNIISLRDPRLSFQPLQTTNDFSYADMDKGCQILSLTDKAYVFVGTIKRMN